MRGTAKDIRNILSQFRMLDAELENLKLIYEQKSEEVLKGVDISKEYTSKTNVISSATENLAVTLAEYSQSIKKITLQINVINTALNGLCPVEKEVMIYRYVDGMCWFNVAKKIGYTEQWCQKIKRQALKKLIRSVPIEIFPNNFFI